MAAGEGRHRKQINFMESDNLEQELRKRNQKTSNFRLKFKFFTLCKLILTISVLENCFYRDRLHFVESLILIYLKVSTLSGTFTFHITWIKIHRQTSRQVKIMEKLFSSTFFCSNKASGEKNDDGKAENVMRNRSLLCSEYFF